MFSFFFFPICPFTGFIELKYLLEVPSLLSEHSLCIGKKNLLGWWFWSVSKKQKENKIVNSLLK